MARKTNGQVGGDHYKKCGIEPVEYIHANGLDFNEGSIVKYISRHRNKNGAEDIRKIKDYCDIILELDYGILPEAKIKDNGDVVMEEQEYPHGETLTEGIKRIENEFRATLLKKGLTNKQIDDLLG
jgi:hypothetical protein